MFSTLSSRQKFIYGLLGLFVFFIITTSSLYNSIIHKDELVKNSFRNLESTLQRRYDLVPNLVNVVKGYANHEAKTLEAITEARSKVGAINLSANDLADVEKLAAFQKAQGELSSALSRLMVVVERYPDLKANASFQDLMAQLEGTENRINVARQKYNDAVADFNIGIRKFPGSMVNRIFLGYAPKESFKANEAAQNAPVVNLQ